MSHPLTEPMVQDLGGSSQTVVTFVVPLSTAQPTASSVPTSNPTGASKTPAPTQFTLHHVPEDQVGAAKEAMMESTRPEIHRLPTPDSPRKESFAVRPLVKGSGQYNGNNHITALVSFPAGDQPWWITGMYNLQDADDEKGALLGDLQDVRASCAGPWRLGVTST